MLQGCLTTKANCKTFVSDSVQWQANVLSPLRNQQIPWFLILSVLKMAYLFFFISWRMIFIFFFYTFETNKRKQIKGQKKTVSMVSYWMTEWMLCSVFMLKQFCVQRFIGTCANTCRKKVCTILLASKSNIEKPLFLNTPWTLFAKFL